MEVLGTTQRANITSVLGAVLTYHQKVCLGPNRAELWATCPFSILFQEKLR